MSKSSRKIEVICPCCQATLAVDAKTGLVLHGREKKSGFTFERAVQEVKTRKEKADELFNQAFLDEKRRHDALEKKFRSALESKDELEEPQRLWDLD